MMNKLFKNVLIAALVLPLTFTSVYAKPGRMGNQNAMPFQGMLQQVELTAEQQLKIDSMMQNYRSQRPSQLGKGVFHEQQMAILKADQFSEAQANDLIDAKQALRKEKQLKRMKLMYEVYHSLTPEQQAKMDLLFSQRQSRMGKQGQRWNNNQ